MAAGRGPGCRDAVPVAVTWVPPRWRLPREASDNRPRPLSPYPTAAMPARAPPPPAQPSGKRRRRRRSRGPLASAGRPAGGRPVSSGPRPGKGTPYPAAASGGSPGLVLRRPGPARGSPLRPSSLPPSLPSSLPPSPPSTPSPACPAGADISVSFVFLQPPLVPLANFSFVLALSGLRDCLQGMVGAQETKRPSLSFSLSLPPSLAFRRGWGTRASLGTPLLGARAVQGWGKQPGRWELVQRGEQTLCWDQIPPPRTGMDEPEERLRFKSDPSCFSLAAAGLLGPS